MDDQAVMPSPRDTVEVELSTRPPVEYGDPIRTSTTFAKDLSGIRERMTRDRSQALRTSTLADNSVILKARPDRKDWHFKLFKTPKETTLAVALAGENKAKQPADKTFFLGVLGGMYVVFGGMFAQLVGYGMPSADPGVARGLYGIVFPVGLMLIVLTGGELFTGNTMYMSTALAYRKIKAQHLITNWLLSYFGNLAGCVLFGYLFGYLTDLFAAEPWLHKIQAVAVAKTSLPWSGIFFSAMAANCLVCLAVFMGVAAEDLGSKTLVMYLPVAAFAACSFEHCVANMYTLTISLLYGAPVSVGYTITHNLLPVTLGNIVGGCFVGLTHYYIYAFRDDLDTTFPAVNPVRFSFTAARPAKLP